MNSTTPLPDWLTTKDIHTKLDDSAKVSPAGDSSSEPLVRKNRAFQIRFNNLRHSLKLRGRALRAFVATTIKIIDLYFTGKYGGLKWKKIAFLAYRNLRYSGSRTLVTAAAVASGSAAIVFLVGFAYGLQAIVTQKLVQPLSLRLTDIQASSTALRLDENAVSTIAQLDGVEEVAGSINVAGSVLYGGSRTEAIVIGVKNRYLEFSHIDLVVGEKFSESAEAAYTGVQTDLSALVQDIQDQGGKVAGASTTTKVTIGQPITTNQLTYYRIPDEKYIPLHESARSGSPIIGYARGSVLDSHEGTQVWGSAYDSAGTFGKQYLGIDGTWYGSWMQTKSLPLYQRLSSTEYFPLSNEDGSQKTGQGFLPTGEVQLLTKKDIQADALLETMLNQSGDVLGESTQSAELETASGSAVGAGTAQLSTVINLATQSATQTDALKALVVAESETRIASEAGLQNAVLTVAKKDGKEIIVSTGMLKVWGLDPADVIGKVVSTELIISGGVIPGISGRVVSSPIEYTVVGVYDDPERNVIFIPLSDLHSMGVSKYTLLKVLARADDALRPVRERVESLGFSTRSIADTLAQVERLFTVMRFLLGSFGMIAFIVALFGMFNTLTVSLLERTREIGVMKTLGTANADVMRLFLVESAFMGAIGGLAGITLGILSGIAIDMISYLFREDKAASLFQFPPEFLLGVFLFSIIVGVFTGLYPATRAKKISALNALRYE